MFKRVSLNHPYRFNTDLNLMFGMHIFLNIVFSLEGGPRYKPPGVSRGSPELHSLLVISVL